MFKNSIFFNVNYYSTVIHVENRNTPTQSSCILLLRPFLFSLYYLLNEKWKPLFLPSSTYLRFCEPYKEIFFAKLLFPWPISINPVSVDRINYSPTQGIRFKRLRHYGFRIDMYWLIVPMAHIYVIINLFKMYVINLWIEYPMEYVPNPFLSFHYDLLVLFLSLNQLYIIFIELFLAIFLSKYRNITIIIQ